MTLPTLARLRSFCQRRRGWRLWLGLLLLLGVCFWGWVFSGPTAQGDAASPQWSFYDRHGQLLWADRPYHQPATPLPPEFLPRLITLEDQDFSTHHGVDWSALGRALLARTRGESAQGGSTLTMQLVKLQHLQSHPRDTRYKFRQIALALWHDATHSKNDIFHHYLTHAYFGQGARGLYEASHRYFSKPPHQLTVAEQAVLFGVLPYPEAWNPITDPQQAHARQRWVLAQWAAADLITPAEAEHHAQTLPPLRPASPHPVLAPHFVQWVRQQVTTQHPDLPDGAIIHTTLDAQWYTTATSIARTELAALSEADIQEAAIIVIDNDTSAVRVMVGGLHFFNPDFAGHVNLTLQPRQTGSTLKPFLYGLALDSGLHPAFPLDDSHTGFTTPEGTYRPANFDHEVTYGQVRLREALANSYNVSAVSLLQRVGVESFLRTLRQFGFTPPAGRQTGLTAVLGTVEASLLTLTHAYSTLAQRQHQPLQSFTHITDAQGTTLWQAPSSTSTNLAPSSPFSAPTHEWLDFALSDQLIRWRVFGQGNVLELPFTATAKTGTSQQYRDNYTLGSTPAHTVGVWVGHADGTPLYTTSGIAGAGPIWHHLLRHIQRDLPDRAFPTTGTRVPVTLCRRAYDTPDTCTETMTEHLTAAEITQLPQADRPPLRVTYPSAGDHFHPQTELLLQSSYGRGAAVQFWLDGQPTSPYVGALTPGPHTVVAEFAQQRSAPLTFFVDAPLP